MTTPVSRQPDTGLEASYSVGLPVGRAHGLRMVTDIGYLLAHAGAQPIHSANMRIYNTVASPITVPVLYCRTPGIQAVLVELELYGEDNIAHGTVSVAVSAGSITWIAQNGLDGSTSLACPNYLLPPSAPVPRIRAIMDVSALTAGTTVELAFTFTAGTGAAYGFRFVHLTEIPLPATNPQGAPTTETGIDAGWAAPSNRLVQGSSSLSRGIKRYVSQLFKAKTEARRHIQITTHDDTNNFTVPGNNTTTWVNPWGVTLRIRARRLYSTAVTNRYTFVVVYRTSDGSTTGSFRISDGTSTTTITGAAASTTRTTATAIANIVTNGSSQEIDLTPEYKQQSGAGYVRWIGWALIETEV